jgi:hypothetical protein
MVADWWDISAMSVSYAVLQAHPIMICNSNRIINRKPIIGERNPN